jgi:hypothetical protein
VGEGGLQSEQVGKEKGDGMIRQKDFQSFNIKNGDVATIRDELDGWAIHITRPDLTHFMHERQRSKHIITCLIYVYPDTDI